MANNDQSDKELNDYLNGNSDVSKAYRASNKTEPSAHLDEKILSAAKKAVEDSKQKTKPKFHKAPWVKPVSIAALVTLSVSLVVTMQQETGQTLISEPEVEMFDSAVMIKESKIDKTTQSSDATTSMNELEAKQNKDERADVPAPAESGASADLYRTEEKVETSKARMKEDAAKKMLSKEKVQQDALEERASAEEQILPSAPTGVEFDDVMSIQNSEYSVQEDALLEIKTLMEQGQQEQAKEKLNLFRKSNPDYSEEAIKEVIGEELFEKINSE